MSLDKGIVAGYDPGVLVELVNLTSHELLVLLQDDYQGSTSTLLRILEQGYRLQQLQDVEYAAHSLKGMACALGMTALASTALSIETCARQGAFAPEGCRQDLAGLVADGRKWLGCMVEKLCCREGTAMMYG